MSLRTILGILTASMLATSGEIGGIVRHAHSGRPLAGVVVRPAGTGDSTLTDTSGAFLLPDIAPGTHQVRFSRAGFQPVLRNDVYVAGEESVRLSVALAPAPHRLRKMTVTGTAFQRPSDMASSSKIMSFDEVLRAPGALVDIQRAVQNLPSVSSGGDNVNEVVVRGGAPGENLFILDNIEIPNPNHFAAQGSGGGVVSLVNPLLVQGLTFCAGAPPAEYGGKASSVLDIQLRDGNDEMVLGGVDLGMAGAGVHAEGPLWNDAVFMASGTRSFLDFVAQFEPGTAVPEYWGTQAKLTRKLGSHKLTLNGLYGDNGITIRKADKDLGTRGETIEAGGFLYAAGTSLRSLPGDKVSSTVTVSASANSFDRREFTPSRGGQKERVYYTNASVEREQMLKAKVSRYLSDRSRITFGAKGTRADFDIGISEQSDTLRDTSGAAVEVSGEPVVTPSPRSRRAVGYKYGGFVSAMVYPVEPVKLIAGVRADGFTYTESRHVSPRLSAVWSLAPRTDLTAAFGLQYQEPDYADLVVSRHNRRLEPKRAATWIVGAEHEFPDMAARVTMESFYKHYDHLAVDSSLLRGDMVLSRFTSSYARASVGEARSYGVELYLHKKLLRSFSGSLAYSLSRAEQADVRPSRNGEWYPADFDFVHNAALTGGWKWEFLDRQWYESMRTRLWFKLLTPVFPIADRMELSARWRFLGGRPHTPREYRRSYGIWVTDLTGKLNGRRFKPYHSLDLRYERRFGFGFLRMIYYFEFQNLYNRRNEWQYLYTDGNPDATMIHQLPLVPAGGMIIGF